MDDHPLLPIVADLKQDIGRVLQGQENLGRYIENVSNSQKEQAKKHDDHVQDDMAHGFKTMKNTLVGIGGVITFVVGLIEFFMHKK